MNNTNISTRGVQAGLPAAVRGHGAGRGGRGGPGPTLPRVQPQQRPRQRDGGTTTQYTLHYTLHVTLQGYIASDPYSSLYGDTHYYNYREDNWDWRLYPRTRSLCNGDQYL